MEKQKKKQRDRGGHIIQNTNTRTFIHTPLGVVFENNPTHHHHEGYNTQQRKGAARPKKSKKHSQDEPIVTAESHTQFVRYKVIKQTKQSKAKQSKTKPNKTEMPPQATNTTLMTSGGEPVAAATIAGFRYTPPSYLLKTKDENRPWRGEQQGGESNNSSGGGGPPVTTTTTDDHNHNHTDEGEYAMRQEDRPVRKETSIDAHFMNRVQKKQSRYRNILLGREEAETTTETKTKNSPDDDDDDDDDLLYTSADDLQEAQKTHQAALLQGQAREARKQRLSNGGIPDKTKKTTKKPGPDESVADAARTLRAARLRTSLLQKTPDEVDVQAKLEVRRRRQKEQEERLKLEEEQLQRTREELQTRQAERFEQERRALEEERRALEQAKREATLQLAQQWQQTTQQQQQPQQPQPKPKTSRPSSRDVDSGTEEDDSLEEVLNPSHKKKGTTMNHHHNSTSRLTRRQRLQRLRRRNSSSGRTSADHSEYVADQDFAFLDDLSHMWRDSGFLTGCVGQCFGEGSFPPTGTVPSSEDSTSTGNPSVTVTMTTTTKQDDMNRLYAKYRE
jgi:hypothetical protein